VVKCVKNNTTGEFDMIQYLYGALENVRSGRIEDVHKWGWTGSLMQQALTQIGFEVSPVVDGKSHSRPWRDFQVVGTRRE
jgi:hypothetical protein